MTCYVAKSGKSFGNLNTHEVATSLQKIAGSGWSGLVGASIQWP